MNDRFHIVELHRSWGVMDGSHPPPSLFAIVRSEYDAQTLADFLNRHAEEFVAARTRPHIVSDDSAVGF